MVKWRRECGKAGWKRRGEGEKESCGKECVGSPVGLPIKLDEFCGGGYRMISAGPQLGVVLKLESSKSKIVLCSGAEGSVTCHSTPRAPEAA